MASPPRGRGASPRHRGRRCRVRRARSVSRASMRSASASSLMVEAEQMQHAVHDKVGGMIGEPGCRCAFASSITVSPASTMSPRGGPPWASPSRPAGKDSTLVEASLPRQMRFRSRISSSPVSTSVTSQGALRRGRARAQGRARSRARAAHRRSSRCAQEAQWRTISISSEGPRWRDAATRAAVSHGAHP